MQIKITLIIVTVFLFTMLAFAVNSRAEDINSNVIFSSLLNGKNVCEGHSDGLLRLYTGTKLSAEVPCLNGKVEGIAKTYHDANHVWHEIPFRDGTKNGIMKQYDTIGNLMFEDSFKDGKRNGLSKIYADGRLLEVMPMKDDVADGTTKTYDEQGNVTTETEYKAGSADGLEREYYSNGKIKSETPYKNHKIDGLVKLYGKNGNLKREIPFKDDIPVKEKDKKEFYENMQRLLSGQEPLDSWLADSEEGRGKRNGVVKTFYSDGSLESECNYKDDERDGICKEYNFGKIAFLDNYRNGTRIDRKEYEYNFRKIGDSIMSEDSKYGQVYVGMAKDDLPKAGYDKKLQKSYNSKDDEEWLTFVNWNTADPGDTITFYLKDGKVKGWKTGKLAIEEKSSNGMKIGGGPKY